LAESSKSKCLVQDPGDAAFSGACNSVRHHNLLLNSSHIHALKAGTDEYFEELKKNRELEDKSLRELSLLRNTIFARYGWSGFRKPWVREHFQKQPWYKPDPRFTEDKLSPEARIELGLISRALGQYASDEGSRDKASASLDRVLSVGELRQLSLRDLRLLRNTIYARRGRPFKSKVLQAHFSAMSWYRKDEAYTDARLTANDKRNIDLIRAVENEFGGPLQDEDWLVDPATDGA